ncbi:HWE histidine kinase domain-containing protein [Hyphomicrobium sp.]|uniref:HWE histidine kinase domain-containing protein n=1 Tax=Hyphomicrobium sp. TaxID=82 RepID=UPI0025B83C68|nr:HWE histidine kinase domain-containing protein [Hyphomicrobium sp.]MCC7252515.1 response regulator [Hyphomicrobium sp.]
MSQPVPADILIVDDLEEKHVAYRASLEELNQNIVTVTSGAEALRLLLERDFAVILLDVNMPDMCGHETAALIRKRKKSRHTPIIFITAFADDVQAAEGYALGAVDYILSPVVPEILRAKVKVFVDLYQMRSELARSHALLERRVEERTSELESTAEILKVEVAERKRAEERLSLLVSELTHRVKNLLAVLQSIAVRTLSDSRDVGEARRILVGRLHALARAHELLTEACWKGADLGHIVNAEVSGFSDRVRAAGPELFLTASAVQTFALVVHELATNAAKYGSLLSATGNITIKWSIVEVRAEPHLEFQWKERGGPPVVPATRKGFGLTLITTMASALTSEPIIDFAQDGLECRLKVPLNVIAAHPTEGFSLSKNAAMVG